MPKALLDTDIFSEITKAKDRVVVAQTQAYLQQNAQLTISSVSVTEVAKGLHKRGDAVTVQRFQQALNAIEQLPFDAGSSLLAGEIFAALEQLGQTIGIADVMIAAIAIANQLTLVSGNQRHYERIQALGYPLQLDNWRKPR